MNLACKIQYTVCNVDFPVKASGDAQRTATELDELLREPIQTAERSEGSLRVVTRTYPFGDGRLVAEFVEDVLFRYSMTSE